MKLSALHPRYEAISRERVLRELVPRVIDLARSAKAHDLNFTVDAEEADRLELSLEVIAAVLADPSLAEKLLNWKAKRSLDQIISSAWNWAQKKAA